MRALVAPRDARRHARPPASLSLAAALIFGCASPRLVSSALTTPGAGLRAPITLGPVVAIRGSVCAPGAYRTLRGYHASRTVRESGGVLGTSRAEADEGDERNEVPAGAAVRNVTISIETALERPSSTPGSFSSGSGAAGGAMALAAGISALASLTASPTFRGVIDVRGEVVATPPEGCAPVTPRPPAGERR